MTFLVYKIVAADVLLSLFSIYMIISDIYIPHTTSLLFVMDTDGLGLGPSTRSSTRSVCRINIFCFQTSSNGNYTTLTSPH
jgi:hypothetical protein